MEEFRIPKKERKKMCPGFHDRENELDCSNRIYILIKIVGCFGADNLLMLVNTCVVLHVFRIINNRNIIERVRPFILRLITHLFKMLI